MEFLSRPTRHLKESQISLVVAGVATLISASFWAVLLFLHQTSNHRTDVLFAAQNQQLFQYNIEDKSASSIQTDITLPIAPVYISLTGNYLWTVAGTTEQNLALLYHDLTTGNDVIVSTELISTIDDDSYRPLSLIYSHNNISVIAGDIVAKTATQNLKSIFYWNNTQAQYFPVGTPNPFGDNQRILYLAVDFDTGYVVAVVQNMDEIRSTFYASNLYTTMKWTSLGYLNEAITTTIFSPSSTNLFYIASGIFRGVYTADNHYVKCQNVIAFDIHNWNWTCFATGVTSTVPPAVTVNGTSGLLVGAQSLTAGNITSSNGLLEFRYDLNRWVTVPVALDASIGLINHLAVENGNLYACMNNASRKYENQAVVVHCVVDTDDCFFLPSISLNLTDFSNSVEILQFLVQDGVLYSVTDQHASTEFHYVTQQLETNASTWDQVLAPVQPGKVSSILVPTSTEYPDMKIVTGSFVTSNGDMNLIVVGAAVQTNQTLNPVQQATQDATNSEKIWLLGDFRAWEGDHLLAYFFLNNTQYLYSGNTTGVKSSSQPYAILSVPDLLILGGHFVKDGNQSSGILLIQNTSTSQLIDITGPLEDENSYVAALAVNDSILYFGGFFMFETSVQVYENIAAYDLKNWTWIPIDTIVYDADAENHVSAIAANEHYLCVGGKFQAIGMQGVSNFGCWNPLTGLWEFGGDFTSSDIINDIILDDEIIVVGGSAGLCIYNPTKDCDTKYGSVQTMAWIPAVSKKLLIPLWVKIGWLITGTIAVTALVIAIATFLYWRYSLNQILPDKVKIDRNQIQILDVVGTGVSSKVYKAIYQGSLVAVKQPKQRIKYNPINADREPNSTDVEGQTESLLVHTVTDNNNNTNNKLTSVKNRESVERELALRCKQMDAHPNITRFYGVCVDSKTISLWLVYEFVQGSTLEEMIPDLELSQVWFIASGIAAGMLYLHNNGVVHGDLAARNILIEGRTLIAKVCDFGMALFPGWSNGVGRRPIDDAPPSKETDVRAFGILLMEMLETRHFRDLAQLEEFKENLPEDTFLSEIARACLKPAKERPTFHQIWNLIHKHKPSDNNNNNGYS